MGCLRWMAGLAGLTEVEGRCTGTNLSTRTASISFGRDMTRAVYVWL